MKKLIILFSFLVLSCTSFKASAEEENIILLIKKQDNATILNMISESLITLDYQTSQQKSLLHLAVIYNNLALVQSLVEQGLALDTRDKDGNTALILSIKNGQELFAENLIDYQADPNIQDNNGDTALIIAAKKSIETIIIALVEKTEERLDPNITNQQNKKAIDYLNPGSLAYISLSRYMEKANANYTL